MITTVDRTGQVPLRFNGDLIGTGKADVGKRRYLSSLYRTDQGGIVLAVRYESDWDRERQFHWAAFAATVEDIGPQLSAWDVIPGGVGYPIGDQYLAKQERLVAELTTAFKAAVSEAFKTGGVVQEI